VANVPVLLQQNCATLVGFASTQDCCCVIHTGAAAYQYYYWQDTDCRWLQVLQDLLYDCKTHITFGFSPCLLFLSCTAVDDKPVAGKLVAFEVTMPDGKYLLAKYRSSMLEYVCVPTAARLHWLRR
jgi:hypothetical protein